MSLQQRYLLDISPGMGNRIPAVFPCVCQNLDNSGSNQEQCVKTQCEHHGIGT